MTGLIIALIIVAVLVSGAFVGLFLSRRHPLPPQDVLDRVARREREIRARERLESGD
jgi:hypothetical protein